MARSCKACSDLQKNAADFVMNGVTDDVKAALMNNEGFNVSTDNDDCTDLNDANDCLIGNMEDTVDAYKVCDWKEFMVDFIHNLWSVLGAIIASICGLWTRTERNTCTIDALTNGFVMNIGEDETDGSYVVAGKGVSFYRDSSETGTKDIELRYIGGALARVTGTLRFSTVGFNDKSAYNYDDDGTNPTKSGARRGNSIWNNTGVTVKNGSDNDIKVHTIDMLDETELLFEIRIKKSAFPGLKSLISGTAAPTGGGNYQVNLVVYGEGSEAHGQHYSSSPTHTVPEGWIYVQARMISIGYLNATLDHHYTPRGFIGVRLDQDTVPCDGSDSESDTDGGSDEGGDTPTTETVVENVSNVKVTTSGTASYTLNQTPATGSDITVTYKATGATPTTKTYSYTYGTAMTRSGVLSVWKDTTFTYNGETQLGISLSPTGGGTTPPSTVEITKVEYTA